MQVNFLLISMLINGLNMNNAFFHVIKWCDTLKKSQINNEKKHGPAQIKKQQPDIIHRHKPAVLSLICCIMLKP